MPMTANGTRVVLAELKDGDAFGEEALLSNAKRNATVVAEFDHEEQVEHIRDLEYRSIGQLAFVVVLNVAGLDLRQFPDYGFAGGRINVFHQRVDFIRRELVRECRHLCRDAAVADDIDRRRFAQTLKVARQ